MSINTVKEKTRVSRRRNSEAEFEAIGNRLAQAFEDKGITAEEMKDALQNARAEVARELYPYLFKDAEK